jgi:hypothetical protein
MMRLTTTDAAVRRLVIASLALAAGVTAAPPTQAAGVRCWVDKGALVAPAAFGDIAGDFLIDPATPASQLHVTRAQLAGLDVASVTRDLVIAGQRIHGLTMAVVDLDARTGHFDTTINGVIGADVLGRFTLAMDWRPCRLALDPGSGGAAPPRPGAQRLEIHMVAGRPLVAARITDGVTVRSGLFALDTGDWTSRIAGAALSRPPPTGPAGTETPIRLRALEVAGQLFEQVPATAGPAETNGADGVIGMAIWSHWRLRLDSAGGWLELGPAPPPGESPAGQ